MNDQEIIHIIESTQRRLDREQAPHFAGSYRSDAFTIGAATLLQAS